MTYRDLNQSLEAPIDKILEGIKEFREATQARREEITEPWTLEHITELSNTEKQLLDLDVELRTIAFNTW